jgi:hypothetical protein
MHPTGPKVIIGSVKTDKDEQKESSTLIIAARCRVYPRIAVSRAVKTGVDC